MHHAGLGLCRLYNYVCFFGWNEIPLDVIMKLFIVMTYDRGPSNGAATTSA